MNEVEKGYWVNLCKDRADSAKILKKASMRNVWSSVVEKYSDQAHFLYELIQNADDAGAKHANFILKKDELIFIHDGTRRFSISNPETEDIDAENGVLGDIKAIASIANSSKNKDKFKIGKFGVGFKAETLIRNSGDFKSFSSSDLEIKMFGDDSYLEKNAFSTGHQSLNVYGAPEKKYEIRSEDYAVDIQVRKYLPRLSPKESEDLEGTTAEDREKKEERKSSLSPIKKDFSSVKRNVKSKDIVFSKEFGKGHIVARYKNENGREMITVAYANTQVSYDSKIALGYGILKQLK